MSNDDTFSKMSTILQETYGRMISLRLNEFSAAAFMLERDPVKLEKMRKHNEKIHAEMDALLRQHFNEWLEKPLHLRIMEYLIENGVDTDDEDGTRSCASCGAEEEHEIIVHYEFCHLEQLLEELKGH